MADPFVNVFAAHNRHRMSPHLKWTKTFRIVIALQLLFIAVLSAFGQTVYPGHPMRGDVKRKTLPCSPVRGSCSPCIQPNTVG